MLPKWYSMAVYVGYNDVVWSLYKFHHYLCDIHNGTSYWLASQAAYFSAIWPQKLICELAREPDVWCI